MITIGRFEIWWNGYVWCRPAVHRSACGCIMLDVGKVGITWLSRDCAEENV
jgi:hypothetical protein